MISVPARLFHTQAIVAISVLLASTTASSAEPMNREKGDRAILARAILRKYCYDCHGGNESHGTIAVLDYTKLVANGPNPVPFVAPKNADGSQIIQFIEDGSMPPGGRPRPTADELAILKQWIGESATSFPAAFDDATTLKVMLADLRLHPDDAKYLRYFSLAHLVRDDAKLPELEAALGQAELALQKAITLCGLAALEPVDGTRTLFRLDTRLAGWDNSELFVRVRQGAPDDGVFPLTPYDLLLLEYPYGTRLATDDPLAKPLDDYFEKAKLVRPVPFLRADWVAGVVAGPLKLGSPLADDLKSLTELHKAFKNKGFPPVGKEPDECGLKPHAFGGVNPIPAAPKPETVRTIPPLGSWYSGDCQIEPPPFKLTVDLVDKDKKPIKSVTTSDPFQLRVKSDQTVNFVLLMVWSDGQVRVQETRQDGLLLAGEEYFLVPKPVKGEESMFRIPGILTGETKANEYIVLLASRDQVPLPVIVRSRHALKCDNPKRFPIYRFFFEPDAKLDQARIVRKVMPIAVTALKKD
jgi:hypothetical protein